MIAPPTAVDPTSIPVMMLWLALMALLPFVLTMVTCFAKIVIVGGLLRQAVGTAQIPPTSVLTGLALILTVHVMAPVFERIWNQSDGDVERLRIVTVEQLGAFLAANTDPAELELFSELRQATRPAAPPPAGAPSIDAEMALITVQAPAFMLTELREAFIIGFLLFVPFLVIDLVVGNVLLAMGMHMLSPVTVSLPLKLLLFVLVDGWRLLLEGLVTSYRIT